MQPNDAPLTAREKRAVAALIPGLLEQLRDEGLDDGNLTPGQLASIIGLDALSQHEIAELFGTSESTIRREESIALAKLHRAASGLDSPFS